MDVLVAGGTGFIGRPLCRILDARGHDVTAASRSPTGDGLPDTVETVTLDVTDTDLTDAVAGHDAVVNLVALPSHVQSRDQSHASVHLDGTRNLVRASEETGVDRFVQMSGLGVESNVSTAYFEAKRGAERVVTESMLEWVIYRPSVVFGDGCAFLPFVERIFPFRVGFLPGGNTTWVQPIWVEDLAGMLADGVEDTRHAGRTYEIGGPEKLTLREIVELIVDGVVVVPMPVSLAAVGLTLAELLPFVLLGRDQYRVLGMDNTTAENDVSEFGVSSDTLLALGAYLSGEAER